MATELKTKYITPDDFENYFGIDLQSLLKGNFNTSNASISFLKIIEDRIASYLDAEFFRIVDREYPNFTEYQKEHYKLALLEQAYYVLRNGEISVDSGYDPDKGIVIDRESIKNLSIGENAKQNLVLCGLWTRKIRQHGNRTLRGWFW